ncbi:hypothetical protein BGZ61DRAFT_16132 [Ilyonectria robusta]|uniref:uncharacterized protein n=1 Tax=Ilyonectria robusta TaxID=1079257 RepID=UPI001E8D9084|nr:uncharacterized protein BGZ61DRAFT_16132 [Ilyonectria robusta]KAH8737444.1 hypothetical protein BGZ61DRAFT_16132 [Ilyonectria robusta]
MPASCICIQAMPTTVLDLGSGQLALVSGLEPQLIKHPVRSMLDGSVRPRRRISSQASSSSSSSRHQTTRPHHIASQAASPDTLSAPRPNLIPSRTDARSQLIPSPRAARCLFSVSHHPQCLTLVSHFPVLAVHMGRIVSQPSPPRHRVVIPVHHSRPQPCFSYSSFSRSATPELGSGHREARHIHLSPIRP